MNMQAAQDYFSHKRNVEDLLRFKDDDSGYIEGKVFMMWPPRNRLHRVNLEVAQGSTLYRFEVEVPHKDGITFRPHERISLALKGMEVDQRGESNAPHYFPIVLRFPNGVVFKYLSGTSAGKVVDTWKENTDEWYNPGAVHTVLGAVAVDASKNHHSPVLLVSASSRTDSTGCHDKRVEVRPPPSVTVVPNGTTTAQPMPLAQKRSAEGQIYSRKKRLRKKMRLQKEKETASTNQLAGDGDKPSPADSTLFHQEKPRAPISSSLTDISDGHTKPVRVPGCTDGEASVAGDSGSNNSRENNANIAVVTPREPDVPTCRLKAGIRTERGDVFTALSDLQKGRSLIDVIAVVANANPERKTSSNEWSRSFTLIDPSTIDAPRPTVTVNCFQKKYSEWLPQVQKDDVVILRKLKIVEFNGAVAATGYSDKLRWAVYEPLQHSIRPPNKGSAPEKETLDDGMGYEFSPYWEPFPNSTVLEYCRQVAEWWRAKNELDGQNVYTVQCSGVSKRHLLISEASPDLPPRGFFNCTVEVLQKFNNHGNATTVYVTDYTASSLVRPVQASWCPPALCDRVLQCDMWDDAKNIAKMMNPGEYWYLHNIRARWNPSHYMEGTMQLAEKITQLHATKLEELPHLKALLLRKSELGFDKSDSVSGSASSLIFPEMLLQDAEGSTSFLTCIVELLHDDLNSRDGHFIYVTDYTYNPDLPTTVSDADWARNLQHRVLKIRLDDAQTKVSLDLKAGSVFIVQNLRIKRPDASGTMHGYLGGENPLIHFLHDSSSPHIKTLERNKEKWKMENVLDDPATLTSATQEVVQRSPGQPSPPVDVTTLQEALTRPAPDTFRVLARVVDFFPFSPEDASALRCTKCKSSPPPSFKHCPRCDDMLETHCKWFYRIYVLLQDEQGTELVVSLSGKECVLLQGVDPTDFHYNRAAFCKFLAKLDPILGNLREVHVAWSENEYKAIESPWMIFTVQSWNIDDERGYGLLDCILRQGTGL